jgi:hypothetical protein
MLLSLPVEIQRQCINYLDTAALKSTRLTSGALKDIATEALFQVATIEFTRESQEKFTALVLNNELRRCIRQVSMRKRRLLFAPIADWKYSMILTNVDQPEYSI